MLLHLVRPRRFHRGPMTRAVGTILLLSGTAMSAWATWAAETTDLEDPGRLVTQGPYAVSRNPMYVGWTLTYVGCALLLGNPWPLILLPGVTVATHREVLREETRLEERFGAAYRTYTLNVRRYL